MAACLLAQFVPSHGVHFFEREYAITPHLSKLGHNVRLFHREDLSVFPLQSNAGSARRELSWLIL